ncbi:MAG: hypothetical protein WD768_06325 [Phycisphaeraceae bacterium]
MRPCLLHGTEGASSRTRDDAIRLRKQAERERAAIPMSKRPLTMAKRIELKAKVDIVLMLYESAQRQREKDGRPPLPPLEAAAMERAPEGETPAA